MPENRVCGIILQMPAKHTDAGDMELLFCQDDAVFGEHIMIAEINYFIHKSSISLSLGDSPGEGDT